jgi:hypothetical protein
MRPSQQIQQMFFGRESSLAATSMFSSWPWLGGVALASSSFASKYQVILHNRLFEDLPRLGCLNCVTSAESALSTCIRYLDGPFRSTDS